MKSVVSLRDIAYPSQLITWSNSFPVEDNTHTRPNLVMVWVKEYKGDREYLVAKWVVED
ncbi:MAG: hypothetical protein QNJ51_09475 [Calothrix sp. MO_167.B12]|nr:hypothetical protein [Calothrix sp. MO_167.B12]